MIRSFINCMKDVRLTQFVPNFKQNSPIALELTTPLVNKNINSIIVSMKPVVQKDPLGCAVACVAFVLNLNYQNSLSLFKNGKKKALTKGFYCIEIVFVLKNTGLDCSFKYIKQKIRSRIYQNNTIVFLKRGKKYPAGHFVCRWENAWMDPWINFPHKKRKAGFRRRLPQRPIYAIIPT